jgi:hypothetical protein
VRRGRSNQEIAIGGRVQQPFCVAAILKGSCLKRGQSRRFDRLPDTSGLHRSTDINRPARLVRFVPKAEGKRLFNYLVGAEQQGLRNRHAERLRGLEVNEELKLGGLFNGQIC